MEQILFNLLSTGTSCFAGFLFFRSLGHGERIQRLEDITGNEVKELKEDMREFRTELKEFKKEVNENLDSLKSMIHREKNQEGQLNQTMKLLLDHLMRHEKDI